MHTQKIEVHDDSGGIQDFTLAEDIKDSRARVHAAHSGSGRDRFSEGVRLDRLLEQHYHRTWSLDTVEERLDLCRESLLLLLNGVHNSDGDPVSFTSRMLPFSSVISEIMLTVSQMWNVRQDAD